MCQDLKIYAERYVLSILLKKSKEFIAFYNSERSNLLNPIVWGVDPTLPVSMRSGFIPDFNKNIIILKKIPIELEDTFDIAHELMHFLFGQKGFPLAIISDYGLLNGYDPRFAGILLNTVKNPLVNSRLAEFGLDLWGYYDKASQFQRSYRETNPQTLQGDRYKYFEVSFYIQKVLDWELANKQSPRPHDDFLEWYRLKYPEIAEDAAEILNEIRQTGYDTPQKVRVILTKIIKHYNMSEVVILQ